MFCKIKPMYFFAAFFVGIMAVIVMNPPKEVVLKFPSPFNAGTVKYHNDKTGSCYMYKAEKTACPVDQNLVKPQPI